MILKFTNTTTTLQELETARIFTLYNKIKNGVKWKDLDTQEKSMFDEVGSFGELYKNGFYLLCGWKFNLKPYLKRYVVNLKYQGWVEFYALSKMQIRETSMNPSYILEIVELYKEEKQNDN